MHINEIKVMRRKNLGNYEHFEVALGASINEGENFEEAYGKVLESLKYAMNPTGGKVAETQESEAKAEPVETKPAKKETKKTSTKKKEAKKEEPVPSLDEMVALCRNTANRLGDASKVKELISQACKVGSLNEADPSTYLLLKKLLEEA